VEYDEVEQKPNQEKDEEALPEFTVFIALQQQIADEMAKDKDKWWTLYDEI